MEQFVRVRHWKLARLAPRVLLVILSTLLAAGCEQPEVVRAFKEVEVTVLDAQRTIGTSTTVTEVFVSARIRNPTTDDSLDLDPTRWRLRLANGDWYSSKAPFLYEEKSTCSRVELGPGSSATCSLYFNFVDPVPTVELAPAVVGYSAPGWDGGAAVEGF
jgi:hypothetical protein